MPELPEVERARRLIAETCTGHVISVVDTVEDTIVYAGVTHDEFADELRGRTITGCERKGKQFWITLSGEGRFPVMHFGMTGMIQLRGQEPTWYRRKINLGETGDSWPPKFCKLILKLTPPPGQPPAELAFIDPRRLGRLRLVPHPVLSHPPLSELGFDPVLSHPTFDEFKLLIAKKKGAVKGVIMDQAFSAGVGNWVADEVLYQARIHPLHPVPALSDSQLADLHRLLREIPLHAISVNADSSLFPDTWLFAHRWDKGKAKAKGGKKKVRAKAKHDPEEQQGEEQEQGATETTQKFLALPDGTPATITFVTVAGRTSAVVAQLQKLPSKAIAASSTASAAASPRGRKRKTAVKQEHSEEAEDAGLKSDSPLTEYEDEDEDEDEAEPVSITRATRATRTRRTMVTAASAVEAKPSRRTATKAVKVKVTPKAKAQGASARKRARA